MIVFNILEICLFIYDWEMEDHSHRSKKINFLGSDDMNIMKKSTNEKSTLFIHCSQPMEYFERGQTYRLKK
jgi:hypothetical protein